MDYQILLLFISAVLIDCVLGEYCTERYNYNHGYKTRTIHCSFGCCGSYYDQYCCVSSTGFIVGMVFAGIFIISVTTAVICCCIKHKGARGRIIHPNTNTTTHNNVIIVPPPGTMPPAYTSAVYSSTQPMMYPPPPAYYPAQPQSFTTGLPPAYGVQSYGHINPPAYSVNAPKYTQPEPPPTSNPFAAAAASNVGRSDNTS